MMDEARTGEPLASCTGRSNDSTSFCFTLSRNDLLRGLVSLPTRSFWAKERLNILTTEETKPRNERRNKTRVKGFERSGWQVAFYKREIIRELRKPVGVLNTITKD